MTEILSISDLRSYSNNECVFFRGSDPDFCYIVLDGSVQETELTTKEYFEKFTSAKNVKRKIEQRYLENVKFDNKGNHIFTLGDVIGMKNLINENKYLYTCLSNQKNTALLLIPKDFFILKMKEKIATTDDNLKKLICRSFQIFIQMGKKVFDRYFNKMIKIFPRNGEFIVSSQQKADSLFIIFQGHYAVNDKEYGDLILLTEGEIFGSDSLNDDENDKKYKFNIISKVSNGVIIQLKIENMSNYILSKIKTQLSDYFNQRKIFINGYINRQNNMRNELSKQYELIGTVKKTKNKDNKIINNKYSNYHNLIKINDFFNKIIENTREAKMKKMQSKRNFNFNIKNTKLSIINPSEKNKNKCYSPKIKTPLKILKDHKQNGRNELSNLFSNKKVHKKILSWNKINTVNNNIYITSVDTNPTDTLSYTNTIGNFNHCERNSEKKIASYRNKIMLSKNFEKKIRNSSLKKTNIYEYVKNTVNYLNDGGIEYSRNNFSRLKRPFSSKFFYDTHKYNIPLYVLCDTKEKNQLNINSLMNFKL